MHFFGDSNCGFYAPWSFLVAATDADMDARWYMRDAAVDPREDRPYGVWYVTLEVF